MRFFDRRPAPDFLSENADRWNQQWTALKTRQSGAVFNWYKLRKVPANRLLLPFLQAQTQSHCSYCDAFPPKIGDDTIDHFFPKSHPAFFMLAYTWANLYIACGHCQKAKMEQVFAELLRPDAADFRFERYFLYNYTSHEIEPNPAASDEDRFRASETIRIFQFNHAGQIQQRRNPWQFWNLQPLTDRVLDDFNFRFMFE